METKTSFCGIECGTCPIYLATIEQDKSKQQILRKSVAIQCSELYGINMQPEEITDCDGCRVNAGRLFSGCVNCEIRKCAQQKELKSCAFCPDYACNTLNMFFSVDPEAKKRLDKIRNSVF